MKKTTAFFLAVAVLAMIAGGVGSIFYYQRVSSSLETMHTEYKIKKKNSLDTMNLTLSGSSQYSISFGEDDKTIGYDANDTIYSQSKNSLNVKEKNDSVDVTVSSKTSYKDNSISFLSIGIFSNYEQPNRITIPSSVKHLVINGKNQSSIDLESLVVNDLTIRTNNSDVSFYQLHAKTVDITTNSGNIIADTDNKAETVSIVSSNSSINLSDLTVDTLKADSINGDIYLQQIRGEVTGKNKNGDIYITDLEGSGQFTNENGNFSLDTQKLPKKLAVNTTHGDINLHANEVGKNISIEAKTKLGDVTLFGKNTSSFKKGKGEKQVKLTSNSGDILVDNTLVDGFEDE